jgi:hypothetical protein
LTNIRGQRQAALGNAYAFEREFGAGRMSRVFLVELEQ